MAELHGSSDRGVRRELHEADVKLGFGSGLFLYVLQTNDDAGEGAEAEGDTRGKEGVRVCSASARGDLRASHVRKELIGEGLGARDAVDGDVAVYLQRREGHGDSRPLVVAKRVMNSSSVVLGNRVMGAAVPLCRLRSVARFRAKCERETS